MGVNTKQITEVAANLRGTTFQDPGADLFTHLADAASAFFEECPGDFCLQHTILDIIVFGDTNRMIWSPLLGFRPNRSHCTPQFLAHAKLILRMR